MDATNMPVRRTSEINTGELPVDKKPVVQTRDDVENIHVASAEVLNKTELEALAFAEEPITILIHPSGEKFAPKVIDLWCNGKGAEVLINGRWVETKAFPIGMELTTKRKYVEILARAKVESVRTDSGVVDEHSERNDVHRTVSARAPFSVLNDKSPKALEWLSGILRSSL